MCYNKLSTSVKCLWQRKSSAYQHTTHSAKERTSFLICQPLQVIFFLIFISCARLKVNRSKERLWAIITHPSSLFCGCWSFWISRFLKDLLSYQKRLEDLHYKLETWFERKINIKMQSILDWCENVLVWQQPVPESVWSWSISSRMMSIEAKAKDWSSERYRKYTVQDTHKINAPQKGTMFVNIIINNIFNIVEKKKKLWNLKCTRHNIYILLFSILGISINYFTLKFFRSNAWPVSAFIIR